ncbi:DUF1992 domain-containing protein [Arthrobacter sp. Br18]|uniref:DnaJ family domain-containing protein n=1 Tax=Arthrobacter sp. Br18 TaxID=1312954 RepID=UPI0004AF7448|nr:DUF1992 domain-containing protein [Arthrobacter sp. Br18]
MSDREQHEERLRRAAQFRAERKPGQVGDGFDAEPDDAAPRTFRSTDDESVRARLIVDDAVRRGEFENLPLAGKPIPGLGDSYDPDWWVKGLIQRENITGLGPTAILLRKEDAELDARLDALYSERQVREALEDFNYRVVDARRQLLGGPPVITKLRDIEGEVLRWQERRVERAPEALPAVVVNSRPWWKGVFRRSAPPAD